jgi:flagellar hook-associated protein 1 FlgK
VGNLFSTMHTAADSMGAIQKALQVTSNNVTNAGTPGYVRQRLSIEARPLELTSGLVGGVTTGALLSSRMAYLENSVRGETHREGMHSQMAFTLEQIEPVFDISQAGGVAGAMDNFFRQISHWAVAPNDYPSREAVLRAADRLAASFNYTSESLGNISRNVQVELRANVTAINRIGEQLAEYNNQIRSDARRLQDPGLDAQIHAALEELARYTDFNVLRGDDGSFNVYLGGQAPLVIGARLYPIEADVSGAGAVVRDAQGRDITAQFQSGSIRSLLNLHNDFIPSLSAELDVLAQAVADRVNGQLATGLDMSGQPPPLDLFTYDPARAAASLRITNIAPEELAGASATAPGGNGNALDLAALATSKEVGDFTFSQHFGEVSSRVGRALSSARNDAETHALLLSQARTLRSQTSEVSLDEEAAYLIAFQRGYQASAQLVRVLNELTETVLGMMR